MRYKIICDGACDLPENYIIKNDISVVPCYCSVDDRSCISSEFNIERVYKYMIENNKFFSTSMPNVQDYLSVFEENQTKNNLIICICMSSKLSGSYQSALIAKNMLEERGIGDSIYIIDSQVDTVVQGLVVQECVEMIKAQLSIDVILKKIPKIIESVKCFFCVGEIKYLLKGGRAKGIIDLYSDRIKIKPILTMNYGEHQLMALSRGYRKAIQKICKYIKEYFEYVGENPQDYRWCIGMGINENDVIELKRLVEQSIGQRIDFETQRIGVVVTAHTGPYLIGVAFVKKYDRLLKGKNG